MFGACKRRVLATLDWQLADALPDMGSIKVPYPAVLVDCEVFVAGEPR